MKIIDENYRFMSRTSVTALNQNMFMFQTMNRTPLSITLNQLMSLGSSVD